MSYDNKVILESCENQDVTDTIYNGLKSYNESIIGSYERKPFSLSIEENNTIVAGVVGDILQPICAVHMAWVSKDFRSKGLGTIMFDKLEEHARKSNCKYMQVDTTEFQAKAFYEKLGFSTAATLSENFKGHTTYILRKELD